MSAGGGALNWANRSWRGQSFHFITRLVGGCTGEHDGTLAFYLIDSRDTHTHTHTRVVSSLEGSEQMIGEGGVVCM